MRKIVTIRTKPYLRSQIAVAFMDCGKRALTLIQINTIVTNTKYCNVPKFWDFLIFHLGQMVPNGKLILAVPLHKHVFPQQNVKFI